MARSDAHNHAVCAADALATAEALAAARGVRLTPLRRQVLSLICQSHKPTGAYQVLAELSRERAENAAPPTVYRALDFLVANGLAHKIDSLNAFVACFGAAKPHRSIFLICSVCGEAQEVSDPAAVESLTAAAVAAGFSPSRMVVELHGTCSRCGSAAS
jgi:Fur family zinc uptake transcriptional regulator